MTTPQSTTQLPTYYDSLDAALAEAWNLLTEGVTDRRSPFHRPVVASVDQQGKPSARTVILRHVDTVNRSLRFYTDSRSAKIAHWIASTHVCLIAYDAEKKIQLRLNGEVTLHKNDSLADHAWQTSRPMSRLTYCVDEAPGAPITTPITLPAPQVEMVDDLNNEQTDQLSNLGRDNFCVVLANITTLEWVYLSPQGNRRALFSWPKGELKSTWLQP